MQRTRWVWATTGFLAFVSVSLASAWFNIQAVRAGYLNQKLRLRLEEMAKREQFLDRRLQESFSLRHLDEAARARFRLQVPSPDQIVLIREPEPAG
jgi:hypothetical protein